MPEAHDGGADVPADDVDRPAVVREDGCEVPAVASEGERTAQQCGGNRQHGQPEERPPEHAKTLAHRVDSPRDWAYSAVGFPVVDRTVSPVKQVTAFIGTRMA